MAIGGSGVSTGLVVLNAGQLVVTNNPALVGAGNGLIADGSITVTNGGSLVVSNANIVIGNVGDGGLTNFGGSILAPNLFVGNLSGSRGTLTMLGGTITTSSSLTLGSSAGATGTLWTRGRRHRTTWLIPACRALPSSH